MTNMKTTKRALFGSCMAMLLCVSMLIGSTFAWFTDTASTGMNKIMAGNLNVELYMKSGNDYVNISEDEKPIFGSYESIVAQDNNLNTLWEPGKTQVAYLMIKNAGNLALKYQVALNTINPANSNDIYKVMQYQIVPDAQSGATWTAGAGNSVTPGTAIVSAENVPMQKGDEHYFALLVHMDEEAGNEYMNGKVEFDISVLATQLNSEADSFGKEYDAGAEYSTIVSTVDELKNALTNEADTIYVSAGTYDFPASSLSEGDVIVCDKDTVFEGKSSLNINGATVVGATFDAGSGDTSASGTLNGKFKDCTFTGGSEGVRWCYTNAGETAVFENCVFETTFRGIHFDGMNGDVYFKNCIINGFNAFGGDGTVHFEGCTFGNDKSNYNGLNLYANANLTNCIFNYISGKTNFIDMEGTGKTLTITNCTVTLDGIAADIEDFVGGSKLSQNTVVYN